jgi:hypothetical protein
MSQHKETKDHYRVNVPHFFEYVRKVEAEGIKYDGQTYWINSSFPADQSCHWKVTGMGGACKSAEMFCHHCGCTSTNVAKYKVLNRRCDWCVSENREKCTHYKVDTNDEIDRKKNVCATLEKNYPWLNSPDNQPFFSSDPTEADRLN